MSIVVFWLDAAGASHHHEFPSTDLLPALKLSEERRRDGAHHVCISTELAESVGRSGVNAVEGGKLPDGHDYDFNKAHRGAGPGSGSRRR